MPHLIFKGIREENMTEISNDLPARLSPIFGNVPDDWFFLEYLPARYYFHGEPRESFPMVQIIWYDKGEEVRGQVAKTVCHHLTELGYQDVKLFFINLEAGCYYSGLS